MNFHENSRTSRAATKNLARSEFRFTGGSIVLDDIGEKPSSLVESHEVARPSADFPFNFLVSPGSAVTGPFCPERNGEFPPRGTAAPASSLPSRIPPAPSLAGARRATLECGSDLVRPRERLWDRFAQRRYAPGNALSKDASRTTSRSRIPEGDNEPALGGTNRRDCVARWARHAV